MINDELILNNLWVGDQIEDGIIDGILHSVIIDLIPDIYSAQKLLD